MDFRADLDDWVEEIFDPDGQRMIAVWRWCQHPPCKKRFIVYRSTGRYCPDHRHPGQRAVEKRREYNRKREPLLKQKSYVCCFARCPRGGEAFWSTQKAKYCSDMCRYSANATRYQSFRNTVLAKHGFRCVECGTTQAKHYFVRCDPPKPKRLEVARVLCGKCNSALSRRKARDRQEFKKGHARRLRQLRREEGLMNAGFPGSVRYVELDGDNIGFSV